MKNTIFIQIIACTLISFIFFNCKKFEYTLPEVSTGKIESFIDYGVCENNLTSDGGSPIITRGVSWSIDPNFTQEYIIDADMFNERDLPTLKYKINNLTTGTVYYVRAFAGNSLGTAYGEVKSFMVNGYTDTIVDNDGNEYYTIIIGSQEWMAKNLNTLHYCNSDPIPYVSNNNSWGGLTTGAYCNNPANAAFGKLYNWYAVNDNRKLAPSGWHVATLTDWNILINYLGGDFNACHKLMESGNTNWSYNTSQTTNETYFTALPAGCRFYNGSYSSSYVETTYWWTSTEFDVSNANYVKIGEYGYYNYDYGINSSSDNKKCGFSVRCVKD